MPNPQQAPRDITARPQGPASASQRTTFSTPQAHPVDTFAAPIQDPTLNGLITGLKSFNPALEQYVQVQGAKEADAAFKAGAANGQLADTLGPTEHGPVQVPALPEGQQIDPAFAPTFAQGYRQAVGAKIGNQISNDILGQYEQSKNAEDFNPEAFLAQHTREQTQGITDPAIREAVAKSIAATAASVRGDFRQVQLQRLKENATQTLSSLLGSAMDPSKTAEQQYQALVSDVEPVRKQMGLQTRAEMAEMVLQQAQMNSAKAGGQPELFDIFTNFKDPATGLTLADMNPKMKAHIASAREQAVNQQNKRIEQGQQADFFKQAVADEDAAKAGNVAPIESYVSRIGPLNQYQNAGAALTAWRHHTELAEKAKVTTQSVAAIGNGTAWGLTKEHAQKAMDTITDPDVKTLMQVASSAQGGDPSQLPEVQQAIRSIVDITGRSGRSDIANSRLKALIDGTVNAVPPKGGEPSSQFMLAAALYSGLPDQVRSLYFDEKADTVFDTFARDVRGGIGAKTAMENGYRAVSPESVKFAKELSSTPEWKAQTAATVANLTTDWWQRWPLVGWMAERFGYGAPLNENVVTNWSQADLQRYYQRNPSATPEQARRYIMGRVQGNFIYDQANRINVQVPDGQASPDVARAISSFVKASQEKYGMVPQDGILHGAMESVSEFVSGTRSPMQSVGLVYSKDGNYQLTAFVNGAPIHKLEDVTFSQIMTYGAAQKILSDTERASMSALKQKLNDGSVTAQDLAQNADLLAKAKSLGQINETTARQLKQVQEKAFTDVSSRRFLFPTDKPDFTGLAGSRLTGQGSKIQVNQAASFVAEGEHFAALTAMGEGLVLKATQDPNPKAGNNIGYGYNLNANKETMAEDFRRAGIPAEKLEGIKEGTVQITQEQAARLLRVTKPRYVGLAQQSVEAIKPGMWGTMSEGQKAALADVAYQTGNPAQFKTALGKLAAGDAQGFQDALRVTYVNSEGSRVEDVRRNKLRALMIAGPAAFVQGIREASRLSQ
ncbi:hypothetical protein [Cupriavidus sp. H39]|uniref:hypothetical protein n=1 Tax=Cupriavidus sp. H39 TaxID=3401635 RepID=UPI003CFCB27C